MRNFPLLLLLALPFAGCASHEDKNPYLEWERKQDADEDRRFFYGSWLHPNSDQDFQPAPNGIAGPPLQ